MVTAPQRERQCLLCVGLQPVLCRWDLGNEYYKEEVQHHLGAGTKSNEIIS